VFQDGTKPVQAVGSKDFTAFLSAGGECGIRQGLYIGTGENMSVGRYKPTPFVTSWKNHVKGDVTHDSLDDFQGRRRTQGRIATRSRTTTVDPSSSGG
jgi:hypothetical protein